jgi:hypothetical protein
MRWWAITPAAIGAVAGSYLLGFLEDPVRHWQTASTSKTVVGALIGGWIAVELIKHRFGVRTSTGDLFAIAVGVAAIRRFDTSGVARGIVIAMALLFLLNGICGVAMSGLLFQ